MQYIQGFKNSVGQGVRLLCCGSGPCGPATGVGDGWCGAVEDTSGEGRLWLFSGLKSSREGRPFVRTIIIRTPAVKGDLRGQRRPPARAVSSRAHGAGTPRAVEPSTASSRCGSVLTSRCSVLEARPHHPGTNRRPPRRLAAARRP
jgi:hypothetical protein